MSDEIIVNLDEVREMISLMVKVSTQSKSYREANFRAVDLRNLCDWERELTSNYGVERRAR